jgi:hypothetical protein
MWFEVYLMHTDKKAHSPKTVGVYSSSDEARKAAAVALGRPNLRGLAREYERPECDDYEWAITYYDVGTKRKEGRYVTIISFAGRQS